MKTGVYLDSRKFDRNMERLIAQSIPEEIEKGMGKAGFQLLNDAVLQTPTVPLKEGTLRGSGSVFVQGKLVAVSPFKKSKGRPATMYGEEKDKKKTVVVVGFNTPYAARLHEGIDIQKWSEPGSGPKYLESKLANNRDQYMKVVADHLKSVSK